MPSPEQKVAGVFLVKKHVEQLAGFGALLCIFKDNDNNMLTKGCFKFYRHWVEDGENHKIGDRDRNFLDLVIRWTGMKNCLGISKEENASRKTGCASAQVASILRSTVLMV